MLNCLTQPEHQHGSLMCPALLKPARGLPLSKRLQRGMCVNRRVGVRRGEGMGGKVSVRM